MPRFVIRFVALVLIPGLLVDPALASGLAGVSQPLGHAGPVQDEQIFKFEALAGNVEFTLNTSLVQRIFPAGVRVRVRAFLPVRPARPRTSRILAVLLSPLLTGAAFAFTQPALDPDNAAAPFANSLPGLFQFPVLGWVAATVLSAGILLWVTHYKYHLGDVPQKKRKPTVLAVRVGMATAKQISRTRQQAKQPKTATTVKTPAIPVESPSILEPEPIFASDPFGLIQLFLNRDRGEVQPIHAIGYTLIAAVPLLVSMWLHIVNDSNAFLSQIFSNMPDSVSSIIKPLLPIPLLPIAVVCLAALTVAGVNLAWHFFEDRIDRANRRDQRDLWNAKSARVAMGKVAPKTRERADKPPRVTPAPKPVIVEPVFEPSLEGEPQGEMIFAADFSGLIQLYHAIVRRLHGFNREEGLTLPTYAIIVTAILAGAYYWMSPNSSRELWNQAINALPVDPSERFQAGLHQLAVGQAIRGGPGSALGAALEDIVSTVIQNFKTAWFSYIEWLSGIAALKLILWRFVVSSDQYQVRENPPKPRPLLSKLHGERRKKPGSPEDRRPQFRRLPYTAA